MTQKCYIKLITYILVSLYYQTIFATNTLQKPQSERYFQDNFKTHYSGSKYNYEGKEVVNKTPTGTGEYADYKNEKPKLEETKNSNDYTFNLGPFSWLVYLILILAVIYLAYILLNEGSSGLFSTRAHKKLETYNDITAENIEQANVNALINKAEKDNDYRLAVRYYYLLVLKTLTLKNYIKFEDDKTNAEYLNEIISKPFSKKFIYTSYLYNYIWYGEFSLNKEQYNKAKSSFITLLKQVKQ